ncbi:hypothetical protein [Epilithonimonas hispanica]|uniref:DNA-directed DNA polymerase family A palm domain-containing protein n=1 Tax=Epilithonimonas hispanica TaxID=358687 RepID=A0A3D9CLK9_9FLAO|nr:hypothetical protein [Epilithonimonas hispanica]REC66600.1 hypothetical protein DRF58_16500 [Epilithonimonas hispanica]
MTTHYTVGDTSNHSNNANNSSQAQDVELNSIGYKRRSSLTLYVPKKIDIDKVLSEFPPDFKFDRDKFVYILHLITAIPHTNSDVLEENRGFTPINKELLQRRIHNYKKYIDYLAERKIVLVDKYYIPDKKSGGLKFSKDYISEVVPVEISKWTLIKSILYLSQNKEIEITEGLLFLKKWLEDDKLEISFQAGKEELERIATKEVEEGLSNIPERFNSRLVPLLDLISDYKSFGVDTTGFRLHTALTRLKKELRKHIRYDGKTLVSIDIVNSQPFLTLPLYDVARFKKNNILSKINNPLYFPDSDMSAKLLQTIKKVSNQEDVTTFIKCVSGGNFYEEFGKILQNDGILEAGDIQNIRKEVKEITFESIFSPNTSIAYSDGVKIFKKTFPNVYEIFQSIKKGRGNHPAFSIMLQRLESELVLEKTCKIINRLNPNIPLFTIHDSIATTEEHTAFVQDILTKVFAKYIGVSPKLKLERWE